jgi:hypothetical protein
MAFIVGCTDRVETKNPNVIASACSLHISNQSEVNFDFIAFSEVLEEAVDIDHNNSREKRLRNSVRI